MKRSSPDRPYLSWCLVVRNCERTLEATLKSLRERTPQAEIVVVDTCSSDSTPEISQRYADVFEVYTGPKRTWSQDMLAVDDMAAARDRSFELASGVWRAWADGDDRVVGGKEAKKLLELNGRWKPRRKGTHVIAPEEQGGVAVEEREPEVKTVGLETMLRWFEEQRPDVTMIWCPYLYQKDEHGHALQWLDRERFVRWCTHDEDCDVCPRFRWAEAAHEVLVPVGDYRPPRVDFAGLIWVHEKDFTGEAISYSVKRHGAIMLQQYEAGEVTYRRCRYLANFAAILYPHRELEFLNAGHNCAWTIGDRYRSLIELGNYYSRRGLYQEARERHDAAIALRPEFPDAYYAAYFAAAEAEDWTRGVDALRKGVTCDLPVETEVLPREHRLKFPSLLSVALQRAAEIAVHQHDQERAEALLAEAAQIAADVRNRPEVGEHDRFEAESLFCQANNAYRGQRVARAIGEIAGYLKDNDEPQKATYLRAVFPHNAEDHPLAVELDLFGRKIDRHVLDPESYADFYRNDSETGYKQQAEQTYEYDKSHPRVRWIADWIAANKPEARVLDLGCCDGIVGIPLMLKVPTVDYTGVDVNPSALDNFQAAARKLDVQPIFRLIEGTELADDEKFDVVIAGEIIEHVQCTVNWLLALTSYLTPDGVILLTTPWGSFDEGHPPTRTAYGTPRDERGHLRAYSVRSLYRDMATASLDVREIGRVGTGGRGDAMVAVARDGLGRSLKHQPVSVYVSFALWKWNGSKVDQEGIGASEECIVRLGEELADREFKVFGPVPQEEVKNGVGYFRQRAIRHVDDGKILVSRAPTACYEIDRLTPRKLPLVLWLQDTVYKELTPEVAARYDEIVCVSEWHKRLTYDAHNLPPETKITVAYNFAQEGHFAEGIKLGWPFKKFDHFIYASSPDRGLIKLLELWPQILKISPTATLSIFYGWKGASRLGAGNDAAWNERFLTAKRKYETLRHQQGITEVGMVDHYRLALEYQKAGVWAYPTDFHETGCLSAVKAQAAGAVPVCSALAALNETGDCAQGTLVYEIGEAGNYRKGYDEAFLAGVERAIKVGIMDRQAMACAALDRFGWRAIRPVWEKILA
jgi:tetratricopeptide (TPR) repeat protein